MTLCVDVEDINEESSRSFDDDYVSDSYDIYESDISGNITDVEESLLQGTLRCETLSRVDLQRDMMAFVDSVHSVVPLDTHDLIAILSGYSWNVEKFQDDWFARPEKKQKCGQDQGHCCNVCFEDFDTQCLDDCGCGHGLCKDCWENYIESRVELGSVCLDLKCPVPGCEKRVPYCLMVDMVSVDCLDKVDTFALESYVENSKDIVWCPGVDCGMAVKLCGCHHASAMPVMCTSCRTEFCFCCQTEVHSPVDCESVKKWVLMNNEKSLNWTWILKNTKPCPSCTKPIEKNQGCMHMTCTQCSHQFCWLCMNSWSKHGSHTGGYYKCNMFRNIAVEDDASERGKHSRRLYFSERWGEHDRSMKIVKASRIAWETQGREDLARIREITDASELDFITDAWREVERCRRTLKWTYVSAYFDFEEHNSEPQSSTKGHRDVDLTKSQCRTFFDFTQNDAENALERLSHRVENELQAFYPPKSRVKKDDDDDGGGDITKKPEKPYTPPSKEDWEVFRNDLLGLTSVTRGQFAKLVSFHKHGMNKSIEEFRDQSHTLRHGSILIHH